MKDGFVKVAAASPDLRVAEPAYNAGEIVDLIRKAEELDVKILVFPELSITGYTCGDLFFQKSLQRAAEAALGSIVKDTASSDVLVFVGYPFQWNGKLYNTAVAIKGGKVLAIIPKKNLPSYGEFYETRWFTPAPGNVDTVEFLGQKVLFGNKIILDASMPSTLSIGCEICEDLWVPESPSQRLALNGATVIVNLSASDEIIGKDEYRKNLISSVSARLVCGYIYADAADGESSTDMVFTGSNLIAENGAVLVSSSFKSNELTITELDTDKLAMERERMNTFISADDGYERVPVQFRVCETRLTRRFSSHPFVPADEDERKSRCDEILRLQAYGLKKRLIASHAAKAVIGLSGGLDSTLALLVTVKAFDLLRRDRKDIIAITMPCFGTTARTKSNAEKLAESLNVDFRTIDITKSVLQHFEDIQQSIDDLSVTYENAQARERTQVLMDVANKEGGIVIGTGDLSELALGWATYNGDHMSMYGVNSSIPKTLVRYLVRHTADSMPGESSIVLYDILATPVSPELLPATKDGQIAQVTEDIVGPYELHDFFLYYMVRFGFPPAKIFRLACEAFHGDYSQEFIKKWLVVFVRRFFQQQFKRSCLPDGPKVGTVTFSPRSDWRMPSDAAADVWLKEAESIEVVQ
ncbi:MAG: NAD(+) synthase [Spirochaetes bacterium]|uniref:Glutamine-dependent NAD(+) synthetase n=1 Tax=Candidatus Ornithospirochaeta stercoripullorum TaxID=2840899 RepID=A0A9D9H512_9SPIO|nr:NAD(+) synthase [Candidatus Ornithospirochaeta stercoripullorum]